MKITIVDPKANKEEVLNNTGLISLTSIPKNHKYTIIILALYHDEFKKLQKINY